ncbi:hypothetical protein niasHT_027483 [Heterodera trifolii]|uniref:Uncharacterized protein n=1 Tax=Heterodera trifolii TaxID=157864 RepID=A0ABD2JMM8_9BILA
MFSNQLKLFLCILASFSIASVEGDFFSDIYEDWIKPAANEVGKAVVTVGKEVVKVADKVVDHIPALAQARAIARVAANRIFGHKEKWECGPDHEIKVVDELLHMLPRVCAGYEQNKPLPQMRSAPLWVLEGGNAWRLVLYFDNRRMERCTDDFRRQRLAV